MKDKNSSLESRDSTLSDDSFITSPDADLNGTVKSTPSTLNGLAQVPKKQKPAMPTSSSALNGLWVTGVGLKFSGNKTQNQICAIEREKDKNENGSGTTARKKTPVLVISDACISYSKDKVYMGRGHISHFMSVDGLMISETNKELIDHNLFKVKDFLDGNPKLGEVMAFTRNNRYIYTLVAKNNQDDEIFLSHISSAMIALKNAMKTLDVKSLN